MLSLATYKNSLSFFLLILLLKESFTSLILGLGEEAIATTVVRRSSLTIGTIG
jgi:hypothetical protein